MKINRTVAVIEGVAFALAIIAVVVFAIDLADESLSATPQSLGIGLIIAALLLVLLSLVIRAKTKR